MTCFHCMSLQSKDDHNEEIGMNKACWHDECQKFALHPSTSHFNRLKIFGKNIST